MRYEIRPARETDAAGIADTACRDDGNIHRVHNLRYQRHRRQFADMTAALHTLRDDRVDARADETLRQRHRRDDRNHLRPDLF